ncbi:heparan-alpha-glucosaminide N-acetyltransferase [Serpentinicella alkaliphila]|uniref:Putative membrane protein n=1 Tax=Serpentinicella alkaliphila TaxID=1734049 RepID=A0A4R2TXZ1_9FIRM|nr:heparan-alpha-glucosaminide N-acetyltransferase [Serpentinicella alkaliphila]QUH26707.1 DUF1624 domain-containing protein [Serpentinicella alkaliphila]TCQ07922.1 putative membrane protein [Serpentinicella alkaliphila]
MSNNRSRIWELDFLKGVALILMIYFHIIFDLREYYGFNINYSEGINFYIGRFSAILFMLLSGISCSLSKNNLQRGLRLVGLALFITLATTLAGPDYSIKFGILHLLGISIIFYEFIRKLNTNFLALLAGLTIWLGTIFIDSRTELGFLFPIGLINMNFYSADYYPLFPWFGVFLLGAIVGKALYSNKSGYVKFNNNKNIVNKLGQRTLVIYLIHQPLILVVLRVLLNGNE